MTEEEEAQIAMYMRVVEFARKHQNKFDAVPELKKTLTVFKGQVQQLFNLLSDEDRDRLLERYNEDLIYLRNYQT